jgi:hypothetical protein
MATAPGDAEMTNKDPNAPSDDGFIAEDVTQLMEHIELTGERSTPGGPEWEKARPADDLEDAPILVGDDLDAISDVEAVEVGEDLELFTETELDLTRRLSQVEDEQLELAAGIGAERERWKKRVAGLRAEMSERGRLLAEREHEIEEQSARLARMAIERDHLVEELRELQRSVGQAEVVEVWRAAPSPADQIIASLHERLRERSRALVVAREEIDELRAECDQLAATIAERDQFIQRLHLRLRELEAEEHGGSELRKLMRSFFGSEETEEASAAVMPVDPAQTAQLPVMQQSDFEPAAQASAPLTIAPDLTADMPLPEVRIEDLQHAPPQLEAPVSARGEQQIRHYLIGLDMVGSVYEMTLPRINVGRTRDNDLRIVDPTVSRLHAVLKVRGREITVIDANSRNGVFVNGIQLRYARLEDGDTLTFGTVRFRYRVGSGPTGGAHGLD